MTYRHPTQRESSQVAPTTPNDRAVLQKDATLHLKLCLYSCQITFSGLRHGWRVSVDIHPVSEELSPAVQSTRHVQHRDQQIRGKWTQKSKLAIWGGFSEKRIYTLFQSEVVLRAVDSVQIRDRLCAGCTNWHSRRRGGYVKQVKTRRFWCSSVIFTRNP